MELGIVLSGVDLEQELTTEEITKIYILLVDTYEIFEQGLCETAYMYEKCSSNKNELYKLVQMVQACIKRGKLDKVANVSLVEFMYIIPQVLSESKTVYLENVQKSRA